MYQEFPKVLYRADEHKIVFDAEEEKQVAALGYTLTQGEPVKTRKPRKAKDDHSTPDR